MSDNQHKPAFVHEAPGFDDHQEPVAIHQAQPAQLSIRLISELREHGVQIELTVGIIEAVEAILDVAGDQRASDALERIARQLGDTAAGVALRRVICGADEPLREAAKRAGVSHQAIHKQENRLRRLLRLTSHA